MVDTLVSLQTNLDFLIQRFCFNLTCYKIIGNKIKKIETYNFQEKQKP